MAMQNAHKRREWESQVTLPRILIAHTKPTSGKSSKAMRRWHALSSLVMRPLFRSVANMFGLATRARRTVPAVQRRIAAAGTRRAFSSPVCVPDSRKIFPPSIYKTPEPVAKGEWEKAKLRYREPTTTHNSQTIRKGWRRGPENGHDAHLERIRRTGGGHRGSGTVVRWCLCVTIPCSWKVAK
jgi:hypothetical protein